MEDAHRNPATGGRRPHALLKLPERSPDPASAVSHDWTRSPQRPEAHTTSNPLPLRIYRRTVAGSAGVHSGPLGENRALFVTGRQCGFSPLSARKWDAELT
uniref:Uncharacterized protein n=1 Tax=Anguilla anguilla TaxID=7936 RepID=A0A0E9S6F9_ANGAN